MTLPKIFLSSFLMACLASSTAWADGSSSEPSLQLEYAQSAGCPGADRFADEVSSKLGFVPWSKASTDKLRVRIQRDGAEVVGSLELPNGDSKVLRDRSCQALFPALVTAVTVAVDSQSQSLLLRGASAPEQAPSAAGSSASSKVHVRSTEPGVTVSRITSRGAAVASNGASAAAVYWEEICIAPCTFEVEAGLREIMISGNGPVASRKLNLPSGGDTYLMARPGSNGLLYGGGALASLGLTSAIVGGVGMLIGSSSRSSSSSSWGLPVFVGGLGAMGLGIGMVYKGRSHLDLESVPDQNSVVHRAVSLRGSF